MEQYWPPLAAGCHWKSVGLDCCEINTLPCENQPFCKTFGSLHSRLVPVPSAQQKKGPEQPLVTCELCCEPALSSADESLSCWVFILAADCLHSTQSAETQGWWCGHPGSWAQSWQAHTASAGKPPALSSCSCILCLALCFSARD